MGKWGEAVNKAGGGIYMDLMAGNNRIRILNDPVVQNKEFQDGPSTVFTWAVWDYATSSVRLLSKGPSFLKKFDFFTEAWGEELPMKCDIIVQKSGSGLATRYEFAAVPLKEELPSSYKEQLERLDYDKLLPNSFSVQTYSQQDGRVLHNSDEPRQPISDEEPLPDYQGDDKIDVSDILF